MLLLLTLWCLVRPIQCNDDDHDDINDGQGLISAFKRFCLETTDQINPTNNLANILDKNHTKAISSGLYTKERIYKIQADGVNFYLTQFGLNFTGAFYDNNTDSYVISNAIMYPYGNGLSREHKLAFDEANLIRGIRGNWFVATFGQVALMIASGIFPNGSAAAGEKYNAGDIMLYAEVNFLKFNTTANTWKNPRNREIIHINSTHPTLQVSNSQGQIEQHSKISIYSKQYGFGDGTFISAIYGSLSSPPIRQANRATYLWPS